MDIRGDVTVEMGQEMATSIGACGHVCTSAKFDDKADGGVADLEALIMKLALMKASGEPRRAQQEAMKDAIIDNIEEAVTRHARIEV